MQSDADPPLRRRRRSTPRCSSARPCRWRGLRPSIGTVGDAYDNALAETTIGLYKTECIGADSPFRSGPLTSLSRRRGRSPATGSHWYNTSRLMRPG